MINYKTLSFLIIIILLNHGYSISKSWSLVKKNKQTTNTNTSTPVKSSIYGICTRIMYLKTPSGDFVSVGNDNKLIRLPSTDYRSEWVLLRINLNQYVFRGWNGNYLNRSANGNIVDLAANGDGIYWSIEDKGSDLAIINSIFKKDYLFSGSTTDTVSANSNAVAFTLQAIHNSGDPVTNVLTELDKCAAKGRIRLVNGASYLARNPSLTRPQVITSINVNGTWDIEKYNNVKYRLKSNKGDYLNRVASDSPAVNMDTTNTGIFWELVNVPNGFVLKSIKGDFILFKGETVTVNSNISAASVLVIEPAI
jgi:hypothetical protein